MATEYKGLKLGLFVSADCIAAAGARLTQGRAEIVCRGSIETPPGAVDGSSIVDPTRVAQAIRQLLREIGASRTRSATVALLFPGYSLRSMRVPDVPVGERRTLVRGELEQMGALPFGGGAFDYLWMPAPAEEGRRQAEVCAYFTMDAEVEAVRQTLHHAGLQLEAMEPASLAMMRVAIASTANQGAIAVLCPNPKHTDLCIHDGHYVRLLRRIPAGWADVRQAPGAFADTATDFGLGSGVGAGGMGAGAVGGGIGGGAFDLPGDDGGADPMEPAAPVPEGLTQMGLQRTASGDFLIAEVSRSLAFYAREFPDAPRPEALVVVGGTDVVEDYRVLLSGSVPVEVEERDPVGAVAPGGPVRVAGATDSRGGFVAAVGAALGSATAESGMPVIDISSQEHSAAARRRAPGVLLVGMAGSTIWMLLAVAAMVTLMIGEGNLQAERSRIVDETDRINRERAPKLAYQRALSEASALRARSQIPAGAILGRIAASVTPGVGVTVIRATSDGKAAVEGQALDTTAMQRFADALGEGRSTGSPYFEMMKRDSLERLTFRMVGTFRGGSAE